MQKGSIPGWPAGVSHCCPAFGRPLYFIQHTAFWKQNESRKCGNLKKHTFLEHPYNRSWLFLFCQDFSIGCVYSKIITTLLVNLKCILWHDNAEMLWTLNTINLIYFSVKILPIFLNNLGFCFFCQNIGTLKGAEGIFFTFLNRKTVEFLAKKQQNTNFRI